MSHSSVSDNILLVAAVACHTGYLTDFSGKTAQDALYAAVLKQPEC